MLVQLFVGMQFHYLHKLESVEVIEQGIAKKKGKSYLNLIFVTLDFLYF